MRTGDTICMRSFKDEAMAFRERERERVSFCNFMREDRIYRNSNTISNS